MQRMPRHLARTAWCVLATVNAASAFVVAPPEISLGPRGARGSGRAGAEGPPALRAQLPDMHASQLLAQAAAVSGSDALRYFFAGGMCCGLSSGLTVPIDVVKTRIQTDPRLRTHSVADAAQYIFDEEGGGALFTGLGSTLAGFTVNGAVKYGLYEVFKPLAADLVPQGPQLASLMLAAAGAEVIASALLCPLEATRIRLVTEPEFGREVFDALPRLCKEQGLGIFRGLPAILLKMVPGRCLALHVRTPDQQALCRRVPP